MTNRLPYIHVITPGDHFSPRTGSAIPTVVDGLSGGAEAGSPRSAVVVTRGSYPDRYRSADPIEYDAPVSRRLARYSDAARGRLGLSRTGIRRVLSAAVAEQGTWPRSVVLAHNLPQLVPLVDTGRHAAVLYAHNNLLRSYAAREVTRVLGPAAAIVAVSGALAEQLRPALPGPLRARLRVVLNGVNCDLFHPDPERRRGEHLEVVMVGRMVRDKGADVLLAALARMRRRDVSLTVVGSQGFDSRAPLSAYEQSLRAQAASLPGQVRFVPFVPRHALAELLRTADVLVVPSRWPEPLGLTVLEGMATGLAVVASEVGGIPEALGPAGVLVPPGDADALAAVLESLADDESARASLGARARSHALAHDWTWAARQLDETLAPLTA
jgi:glycosyltransferase involved in cell wall biosynthesis